MTLRALSTLRTGDIDDTVVPFDTVTLDYEARFFRRKGLVTDGGQKVLADLAQTISLDDGDALQLEDGRLIAIRAAAEPLLRITGSNLPRLAWHIGNRHTPCQIESDHLLIRLDKVIGTMLEHLGAGIETVEAPFLPEGGAYGHGRTHSHEHGKTVHDGSHAHDHGHSDGAGHSHVHSHDAQHAHSQASEHAHSHDHPSDSPKAHPHSHDH